MVPTYTAQFDGAYTLLQLSVIATYCALLLSKDLNFSQCMMRMRHADLSILGVGILYALISLGDAASCMYLSVPTTYRLAYLSLRMSFALRDGVPMKPSDTLRVRAVFQAQHKLPTL